MLWMEDRVNRTIGLLLRAGVLSSALVVVTASMWFHVHGDADPHIYHIFHGEPESLRSPTGVIHAAIQGNIAAWIQLGLLILIATPVARVVYSAAAFALQRDWTYTAVTLIVLAVLIYGLW